MIPLSILQYYIEYTLILFILPTSTKNPTKDKHNQLYKRKAFVEKTLFALHCQVILLFCMSCLTYTAVVKKAVR